MMRPAPILTACLLLAACAAPREPLPDRFSYAPAAVQRARTAAGAARAPDTRPAAEVQRHVETLARQQEEAQERFSTVQELEGLHEPPSSRLREVLADDERFDAWLQEPRTVAELGLAAWVRHPALETRRKAVKAALEDLPQAAYLEEVISRYRTFSRTLMMRVGPMGPLGAKVPESSLAPWPAITALEGELAMLGAEVAWQQLREEVVARLAAVRRTAADLIFVRERRRVVSGYVELLEELLPVVRSRVEAGRTSLADLLTLEGSLEDERTRLDVLEAELQHARTALARAVDLPPGASVSLAGPPEEAPPPPPAEALAGSGMESRPDLLRLKTLLARQRVMLRLGEAVTVAQVGVGGARFERGLGGEAGVARARELFPTDPRTAQRASGYGPVSAYLQQLRRRVQQLEHRVEDRSKALVEEVSAARTRLVDAASTRRTAERDVVPLARDALEALEGGYAGNRVPFLDLYRGARRLLDNELALARARRDEAHAQAGLMEAVGRRVY